MANEINVQAALTVRKTNLQYTSQPAGFAADMTGAKGPTPGAVTVTTAGVDIDLSGLTTPGWCRIRNVDATNYAEVGVHDGAVFHPFLEVGPGQSAVFCFARNVGEEHVVSGTGTTGTVNTVHAKANQASVVLQVDCFEK